MIIWTRDGGGSTRSYVKFPPSFPGDDGPAGGRATIPLTDPLTSLGNRQLLEKDLAVYEGQVTRYGLRSCIALIDIDEFKEFNDRYGREKATKSSSPLPSDSRVALAPETRLPRGRDEFICLLPEQTLETGAIAVDRMRRNIEELAIPNEDSPSASSR